MDPQRTAVTAPIKLQIADEIRIQIERGELQPGDSIPTIHELTEAWSCSTASAREAMSLLKEQGLVTGGRGRPLRVRAKRVPTRRSSKRHQLEKDLVRATESERGAVGTSELETNTPISDVDFEAVYDRIKADGELAQVLGVEPGTEVLRRSYETREPRSHKRTHYSVSYIPTELVESNPELLDSSNEPWPGGTMHQLSTVGIEVMTIVDEVTSRMATTVERQQWGIDEGVPIVNVRRISKDGNGRVVEVSDAPFPSDRTVLEFVTHLKAW